MRFLNKIESRFFSGSIFLLCAVILFVFYFLFFVVTKHLPIGHETLQYMQCQYVFLNEAVSKGEFAFWLPFMTKGTVGNWWFLITNGIFSSLYYVLAPFLKHVNFYDLFYLSIFFEELVLVLGIILLSRYFYKSNLAVLFVVLTALGMVNWTSQIWWNFHIYYLLPLVFYLLLTAFKKKSFYYFLLSGCFFILWCFSGNLFYFLPLFSFVTFLFFAFYFLHVYGLAYYARTSYLKRDVQRFFKQLGEYFSLNNFKTYLPLMKWGMLGLFFILILAVYYFFMKYGGTAQLALAFDGRQADGSTTLFDFLHCGRMIGYGKYFELLTGLTENISTSTYIGVFGLVFALFSFYGFLKNPKKNSYVFALLFTILVLLSFSAGGFAAILAYLFWPQMKLFRYIGYVGVLVKVLMLFLAGFGFEYFLQNYEKNINVWKRFFYLIAIFAVLAKFFILFISGDIANLLNFRNVSGTILNTYDLKYFVLTSVVISFLFFILLCSKKILRKKEILIILILVFQFIEMAAYRVNFYVAQMPAIDKKTCTNFIKDLAFYDYNYMPLRTMDYTSTKRSKDLLDLIIYRDDNRAIINDLKNGKFADLEHVIFDDRGGLLYWQNESFAYLDVLASAFRSLHLQRSVAGFYKLYEPTRLEYSVEWPLPAQRSFYNLIGYSRPKIQFFKNIYCIKKERILKDLVGNNSYLGNFIFTNEDNDNKFSAIQRIDREILNRDDRVNLPYAVKSFNSNSIKIKVNNTTGRSIVMYYADAYHEQWQAFVNDKEVNVIPANIGFKAIILPAGISDVEFSFQPLKNKIAVQIIILFNIFGIFALLGLFFNDFLKKSK